MSVKESYVHVYFYMFDNQNALEKCSKSEGNEILNFKHNSKNQENYFAVP